MPNLSSRLAVCMHEAGHAIVQLADYGSPWIDWISVESLGNGALGRVETESLWQPSSMTCRAAPETHEMWTVLAWRDIIHYLAGPIAELKWRKLSRAAIWFSADEMAEQCLGEKALEEHTGLGRVRRRLTSAIPGDNRSNFVKAWLEAEERVVEWWREIRVLGRTLDDRGRLNDEELRNLWKQMKADRKSRNCGRPD